MKKFLLATALFVGVAFSSFAQSSDGGKFSIGVDAGIPVGSTSNTSKLAIGGSLKYDLPIAESTAFTISAGYTSFSAKSVTIGATTVTPSATGFVPVKLGIKYNLAEAFYAEGQLGAVISTASGAGSKVAFAYAPGIGYNLGGGIDLGVRYEGWAYSGATISQVAARLAISF